MTEAEQAIFNKLNPCRKAIAILMDAMPTTRNLSNDDFIKAFRLKWNGKSEFTSETITRCRRFVQNTAGLFKKNGAPVTWKAAIKAMEEEQQLSFIQKGV